MIRIPHATMHGETFVAASAVASISSAGWSANYSLRSIVRLHNGQVIESSEDAATLVAQVEAEGELK